MTLPFYAAEVSAYRPGDTPSARYGHMTRARMTRRPSAPEVASDIVLRASDVGYVAASLSNALYPPVLVESIQLNRQISLAPGDTTATESWGSIRLSNSDGTYDDTSVSYSADARPATIRYGVKTRDPARGILVDPAYSSLQTLFAGLAQGWFLSETSLEIPLRDATYWLERRYQQDSYGGTGGYDGHAGIAGQTKPRTRGGSSLNPIRAVSPVLIDVTNRIYAYTDGPGTVLAVYENGVPFGNGGNTTDLYSGTTSPGQYRTDNSRGMFQLGSNAAGVITADVTGAFPIVGQVSFGPNIARYILTEDLQLPAANIDLTAFSALASARGWVSGWHWPSGDTSTGAEAVSVFLRGLGAKLLPKRNGRLTPVLLTALPEGATAVASLTPGQIVDLRPNKIGAPLDPPASRWRVGYRRNHTVQTTGLSALLTDAQAQDAGQEWRLSERFWGSVSAAQARPSDPDIISTALLVQANAETLVEEIIFLWGPRRRLYDVTVPVEIGLGLDIGDVVSLTYPLGDLRTGKLGQVVGEQIRTSQATSTLQVLV